MLGKYEENETEHPGGELHCLARIREPRYHILIEVLPLVQAEEISLLHLIGTAVQGISLPLPEMLSIQQGLG